MELGAAATQSGNYTPTRRHVAVAAAAAVDRAVRASVHARALKRKKPRTSLLPPPKSALTCTWRRDRRGATAAARAAGLRVFVLRGEEEEEGGGSEAAVPFAPKAPHARPPKCVLGTWIDVPCQ